MRIAKEGSAERALVCFAPPTTTRQSKLSRSFRVPAKLRHDGQYLVSNEGISAVFRIGESTCLFEAVKNQSPSIVAWALVALG